MSNPNCIVEIVRGCVDRWRIMSYPDVESRVDLHYYPFSGRVGEPRAVAGVELALYHRGNSVIHLFSEHIINSLEISRAVARTYEDLMATRS